MKKQLLLSAVLLSSAGAFAESSAQDRHQESCLTCHIIEHNDDFYTREVTRIKTHLDLSRQVNNCVSAFSIDWWPEEIKGEVNFLNDTYYKFQK